MPTLQEKIKSAFDDALEIEAGHERHEFLAQRFDESPHIREGVESLLKAYDAAGSFLESPPDGCDNTECAAIPEKLGTSIGPYKLLQQLGEGGMGVVYLAERQHPVKQRVALKIIKLGMDSKKFIARFEAERQALAMMEHPNIAKVLDAGCTEAGRPYFVMELVKGIPISDFCDENRLTTRERLELFVQVCEAVNHAHQKGIIHRDIKPSNVLVAHYDDKPVPRVIDFGIAKATNQQLTEKTLFTEVGAILGTWEYMSPEQAVLNQLDVDTRSDVYSLGVLLYEILTGETPLSRGRLKEVQLTETLRLIREEEPPKPSTRVSSLGERAVSRAAYRGTKPDSLASEMRGDLDWIVMKSLSKERSRRYDTAKRFAEDICRHLDDQPIEARPPSVLYQMQKFYKRNRAFSFGASAVAIALLAGVIGNVNFRSQIAKAREDAVESDRAHEEIKQTLLARMRDDAFIDILSGNREAAADSIHEASSAGLSEGWSNLLTGLLKLHHGEPARVNLDLASNMLPNSTAAYAALVRAYYDEGMEVEYFRRIERLQQMEPQTVEDKLLKGWALIHASAQDATDVLDSASRESEQRPIVRLIRAEAYIRLAMETNDAATMLAHANVAIADANFARLLLPDHPSPKETMLRACLLAAHASEELGDPKRRQKTNQEAAELFDELGQYPSHQGARLARVAYANVTEDPIAEQAVFQAMSKAVSSNGRSHPFLAQYCTQMRFRRQEYDEAVAAYEFAEASDGELSHGIYDLVEMTQADSPAANLEFLRRFEDSLEDRIQRTGKVLVGWDWIALRLLGARRDHPAAVRLANGLATGYGDSPYWESYVALPKYMRNGDSTELLRRASGRRTSLLYAHFLLGVDALSDGRRTDAIGHFEDAVATGAHEMDGYGWAKAFLVHLNANEDEKVWLPWLGESRDGE